MKIQIGSVCSEPAVNVVTMISSNDRAKASRAPATSAVRSWGKVMSRKVCQEPAPRSLAASSSDVPVRRRRATALL